MKVQWLREKYVVTEWRDGCVFKTRREGLFWVDEATPLGETGTRSGVAYASLSTRLSRELGWSGTMRRVPESVPNFDPYMKEGA